MANSNSNLKQALIHNGLLLLNQEGIDGFSLRKVALMCGVSHNAPYKHFKNKEELIQGIINEVWKEFHITLSSVAKTHPNNSKLQLIELGKAYVRFMVENPEYLKFMFLSDHALPIAIEAGTCKVEQDSFICETNNSFAILRECAEQYFQEKNVDTSLYLQKTLALWSLVHGIAILIAKKNIEYKGDYLTLVESMIQASL